jgi:hypothetical protein
MKASGLPSAQGTFSHGDNTITLKRSASDKALNSVLPHELRHLWQDCALKGVPGQIRLSGPDMLVLARVIEGDAYAYQDRFDMMAELSDEMGALFKNSPKEIRAAEKRAIISDVVDEGYSMKSRFMAAQRDLGEYDKITLAAQKLELKKARLCIKQMKLIDAHPELGGHFRCERAKCATDLAMIFDRVTSALPLNDKLVNVTREGLGFHDRNYLGFKTAKALSAFIRKQIPRPTLKKAQAMDEKIKRTIEKAMRPQ